MISPGAIAMAISRSDTELWWSVLGMGAVVIVCVVILLTLLAAFVRDIEHRLQLVAVAAADTCAQLAQTPLIPEAADLIGLLAVELERHGEVVSARAGEAT